VHVGLVPLRLWHFSTSNVGAGSVLPKNLLDLVLPIFLDHCCTIDSFCGVFSQLYGLQLSSIGGVGPPEQPMDRDFQLQKRVSSTHGFPIVATTTFTSKQSLAKYGSYSTFED